MMSSDMMIICKEDGSEFEGARLENAFFVDECSMGDPWNEFGKWFGSRFCGAPGILEQMHGKKDHHYTKVTQADIAAVEKAFETMECHEGLGKDALIKYLNEREGKHISTENW